MYNFSTMNLSIVIPVYKVEKYVGRCLSSIYSQKYDENLFDVIVVDDGSPDRSIDIVENFAAKHSNMKIIRQQNEGLSSARNKGLINATGDYVWFVDSDDQLNEGSLSLVSAILKENQYIEVISSDLIEVHEDGQVDNISKKKGVIDGLMTGFQYMRSGGNTGAVQRFVYSRIFLVNNGLTFQIGKLHEDGEFSLRSLYFCSYLYKIEDPIYKYTIRRDGSIMSNVKIKSMYDIVSMYMGLCSFRDRNVNERDKAAYSSLIFDFLTAIFRFSFGFQNSKDFKLFYRKNKSYIRKSSLALLLMQGVSFKYRIKAFISYLSPIFGMNFITHRRLW